MEVISNPATANALMADSRPEPGPLIFTSMVFIPIDIASFPTFSAAIVAAYAVLFLDPLKPLVPAVDHTTTFPNLSVNVIWVLLKVALMWAIPAASTDFFFWFLLYFFDWLSHCYYSSLLPSPIVRRFPLRVLEFVLVR